MFWGFIILLAIIAGLFYRKTRKIMALFLVGLFVFVVYDTYFSAPNQPETTVLDKHAPATQKQFLAAVSKGQAAFSSGTNDFQQNTARQIRSRELCEIVRNPNLDVYDWIGKIDSFSTEEGTIAFGLVTLGIGSNIRVGSANDIFTNPNSMYAVRALTTKLVPGTQPYVALAALNSGDTVKFSGQFSPTLMGCVYETSQTVEGSMTLPYFLFRITKLEKFVP